MYFFKYFTWDRAGTPCVRRGAAAAVRTGAAAAGGACEGDVRDDPAAAPEDPECPGAAAGP